MGRSIVPQLDHTSESDNLNHLTSKSALTLLELSNILRNLQVNEMFWRLVMKYRLARIFYSLKSRLLQCSSAQGFGHALRTICVFFDVSEEVTIT